jgi:hypothetical protein
MRRIFVLSSFVLALFYISRAPTLRAQGLKLAGATTQAFTDANETIDSVTRLQTALSDFQQGKKPNTSGNWSHLADRFQLAARRLSASPSPDLRLSQTPLIYAKVTCKGESVMRSRTYLEHLRQTQSDGAQSVKLLDDQLGRIDRAKKAIAQIPRIFFGKCLGQSAVLLTPE